MGVRAGSGKVDLAAPESAAMGGPAAAATLASHVLPLGNPFGLEAVNILLLGTDAGQDDGRTDTIILLAADLAHNALGAVSIPRDTRVKLPDGEYHKINAAYRLGGAQYAAQAAADLTRVPVHHLVRTDLSGFEQIVDAVGGVELTVEKRMRYTDRAQGLEIDLRPGRQRLDGDRAMQYVRFRNDAEGDLGRIRRQQNFLRALAAELVNPRHARRLPELLATLAQHVETTLSPLQIVRLVQLVGQADCRDLVAMPLPGQARSIDGISYYIAGPEARDVVSQVREAMLRPPVQPLVTVYNGSDRIGLDGVVVERLQEAGCAAVLGSSKPVAEMPRTRVYGLDGPGAPERVATALGVAPTKGPPPPEFPSRQASPIDGFARVVVVLGVDCPTH